MNHIDTTVERVCQNCGYPGVGKYCSNCGLQWNLNQSGTVHLFVDSFFKLNEIRAYVVTYLRYFRGPVSEATRNFESATYSDALRFLGYSVSIFLTIGVSRLIIFRTDAIISNLILSLVLLVTFLLNMNVFFNMVKRDSSYVRTSREFIEFWCWVIGFTLPIVAVGYFIQSIDQMIGVFALLILVIPLFPFIINAWSRFLHMPRTIVVAYLFASSAVSGIIAVSIMYLLGLILPIGGYSQVRSVEVDELTGYTHPDNQFSISIPPDWKVNELNGDNDSDDRVTMMWADRLGNAVIVVDILELEEELPYDALSALLNNIVVDNLGATEVNSPIILEDGRIRIKWFAKVKSKNGFEVTVTGDSIIEQTYNKVAIVTVAYPLTLSTLDLYLPTLLHVHDTFSLNP